MLVVLACPGRLLSDQGAERDTVVASGTTVVQICIRVTHQEWQILEVHVSGGRSSQIIEKAESERKKVIAIRRDYHDGGDMQYK